ncbi:hypothetical protein B0H14DRAFT_2906534, partial [Mycena olivaceomarginata]
SLWHFPSNICLVCSLLPATRATRFLTCCQCTGPFEFASATQVICYSSLSFSIASDCDVPRVFWADPNAGDMRCNV